MSINTRWSRVFVLVLIALLSCLTFTGASLMGTAEASTSVLGIMYSDAVWTKASSPYTLTGPVAVNSGVTLTIEAGTIVNLNGFYIQVNGTLNARGSSTDKTSFSGGSIIFTSVSNSWNEGANSGSIVENAVLGGSISIRGASPKITASSFEGIDVNGNATISHNTISSVQVVGGAPSISYNTVSNTFAINGGSPLINNNTINGVIWITRGAPIISGNRVLDEIHADTSGGQLTITDNELSSKNDNQILFLGPFASNAEVSGNKIIGNGNNIGIVVAGSLKSAFISGNQVYGCETGIIVESAGLVQITGNSIFNNTNGMDLRRNASIQDNNISQNSVGILMQGETSSATIINNNIQNNSAYNFKLQGAKNVTIANNWWGTADAVSINQTIFDNKNDFNVGTVSFTPFLTEPATPSNLTTPSPAPTASPSPSPASSSTPTASPPPTSTLTPTLPPTNTPAPTTTPSITASPSFSPNPTTSPAVTQGDIFGAVVATLAVAVVVLFLAVVVLWRKIDRLQKDKSK